MTKRFVIALAALALALAACGGGGSDDGGSSNTQAPATDAEFTGLASEGERLFAGTCATCHGVDALGIEGLGKSIVGSAFIAERTDAEMVAFIQEGRPASHPDNTTGVDMPPRGGNPSLDDQALYDIVAYARTLN